jgi:hypothetical protein
MTQDLASLEEFGTSRAGLHYQARSAVRAYKEIWQARNSQKV